MKKKYKISLELKLMPKVVRLEHGGIQGGKCRCPGQRQLELLNFQMSLSMTVAIGIITSPIAAIMDSGIWQFNNSNCLCP